MQNGFPLRNWNTTCHSGAPKTTWTSGERSIFVNIQRCLPLSPVPHSHRRAPTSLTSRSQFHCLRLTPGLTSGAAFFRCFAGGASDAGCGGIGRFWIFLVISRLRGANQNQNQNQSQRQRTGVSAPHAWARAIIGWCGGRGRVCSWLVIPRLRGSVRICSGPA
jgi:hypothetical protein